MNRPSIKNIPNALTLLRMIMIPAFVYLYFILPEKRWVSLIVFVAACVTDVIDGYLARKWNQITWFGKLFDPLADKLMTLFMLSCLASTGYISWWILLAVFVKDLYLVIGATYLARQATVVHSDLYGKLATVFFIISCCLVFPWHDIFLLRRIGTILMYLSLVLSYIAMVHYTVMAVKKQYDVKSD